MKKKQYYVVLNNAKVLMKFLVWKKYKKLKQVYLKLYFYSFLCSYIGSFLKSLFIFYLCFGKKRYYIGIKKKEIKIIKV